MNEALLLGIGFIVFVITSTATLLFGYLRFSELYRSDRDQAPGSPAIVMEGNTEVLVSPDNVPGGAAVSKPGT